jgi:hypothetical protein
MFDVAVEGGGISKESTMPTKFLIATMAVFLAASPALAGTQAATKGHATANSIRMKAKMHHHHRMARKVSMRGDAEVRALNALEAAGYREFDDFHAQGKHFVATATKAGKFYGSSAILVGRIC